MHSLKKKKSLNSRLSVHKKIGISLISAFPLINGFFSNEVLKN